MMPGTQPQRVKSNTIRKEPQPFPITASGGKMMANKTRQKLMFQYFFRYPIGRPTGPFVTGCPHQFQGNVPCLPIQWPSLGSNGQIKGGGDGELCRKSVILRFTFFLDYATIGTRDRSKGKIGPT